MARARVRTTTGFLPQDFNAPLVSQAGPGVLFRRFEVALNNESNIRRIFAVDVSFRVVHPFKCLVLQLSFLEER
jgi:hypothetical protein